LYAPAHIETYHEGATERLPYTCTPRVKKGCHPNHGYNFVNSWLICKLLSLLQRAVNFQQNQY